ncbi:MAG: efflux RND transporter periplasmic adaptor subunit [Gammaproteobacteria bacterium]|nr:efflux RND transporter periplasmic adaptor subunit [Gammaproteobacteria bacterium]
MDLVKAEKFKKITRIILIILLIINIINYYNAKYRTVKIPLPTVQVQQPVSKAMSEYVTQTGNTVAFNAVDLVARVEGYLNEIDFIDGTFVKKGKTLFVIEPEPYIAKLKEAEAELAAQQAIHTYDELEYARQKKMYKQNATSLSNVEKWLAKSEASTAEVEKAKENLVTAQINYSYTQVKAPFDGHIGRHLIDKANLVGHGIATVLATIEQLNPIYVYFNLNEIDLIILKAAIKEQDIDEKVIRQVPVEITLPTGKDYKFKGKLDFINTGLNASTGTLEFRALLPNTELVLLPGLFVQIKIALESPIPRLTVPDTALQYDQIGPYLLLMNQENRVVLKRVTLGPLERGIRAISHGIDQTDNVIVKGLQSASEGNLVNPIFDKKKAK